PGCVPSPSGLTPCVTGSVRVLQYSVKIVICVITCSCFGHFSVNLDQCGTEGLKVTSSDPDFAVQTDGTVITTCSVVFSDRTVTMLNLFSNCVLWECFLLLKVPSNKVLKRYKRRWSPPPFSIKENQKPPFPKDIEVIASDSSQNYSVRYTISGPGVRERPYDVFSIDEYTGMLRVHKTLDREEFNNITVRASSTSTNAPTDLSLPVTVIVEDENDNAPEFSGLMQYTVMEHCNTGTLVGVVRATDKDDPSTPHAKIKYRLGSGTELFLINEKNGSITARTTTLDRERQDKYLVPVEIRDMEGHPSGLSQTGTATITLGDINDNPPTFKQPSYTAEVEENKANVLILRIPVEDKDLVNTDNWRTRFVITKGNETGNFRIDVDPKTNEGLLYVVKPLDYEETKSVELQLTAQNVAKLEGTTASWSSIPVTLNVKDVDEGPEFRPGNLYLLVKENVANGTVIGTYTATDPETKKSNGMRYYKRSDPASWINVVESTGQLKVANTIDRESSFVNNSMYNITVEAVDESKKTGTGTVIIQIEDINDNMPEIKSKELVLCEGSLESVRIEASDQDNPPFSAPFFYELGKGHDGKWKLEDIKDTSAVLKPAKDLPTGVYSVPVMVKDLQGFGKEQTVTVQICHCSNGACLAKRTSTSLGVGGVLAILMSTLLLLLLCLLFAFVCTTKKDKIHMDDTGDGMLLKSNTEGPGDEVVRSQKSQPLWLVVQQVWFDYDSRNMNTMNVPPGFPNNMYQKSSSNMVVTGTLGGYSTGNYRSIQEEAEFLEFASRSTLHTWMTNALYLDKKLMYFATEDSGRYADDIPLRYGYEGRGSLAGSVGCCSELGADEGLGFLDSLGPKFKTLAEICMEK
uniref:Desmocollin 2 like n=1 Tax=Scleropages formosus TaxID=113540 RepID=A0A8C9VCW9_SCLFO